MDLLNSHGFQLLGRGTPDFGQFDTIGFQLNRSPKTIFLPKGWVKWRSDGIFWCSDIRSYHIFAMRTLFCKSGPTTKKLRGVNGRAETPWEIQKKTFFCQGHSPSPLETSAPRTLFLLSWVRVLAEFCKRQLDATCIIFFLLASPEISVYCFLFGVPPGESSQELACIVFFRLYNPDQNWRV